MDGSFPGTIASSCEAITHGIVFRHSGGFSLSPFFLPFSIWFRLSPIPISSDLIGVRSSVSNGYFDSTNHRERSFEIGSGSSIESNANVRCSPICTWQLARPRARPLSALRLQFILLLCLVFSCFRGARPPNKRWITYIYIWYISRGQFLSRQFGKQFGNRKISFESTSFLIFCPFHTACLGRPIGPLLQIGNFRLKRNFFIISAKFWD